MNIITRTHSSVGALNGAAGSSAARNGKSTHAIRVQPAPSRMYEEIGRMISSDRFSVGSKEALRREFVPVAAGRSEAAWGLPGRASSEDEIILLYCIKGRGWCEIEGERRELTPGQLLVMPARLERSYQSYRESAWSLIWMQLAEINTAPLAEKLSLTLLAATAGPHEKTQILALFQQVLCALEMPCRQRIEQVSHTLSTLLVNAIPTQHESSCMDTDATGRIGRTLEYMKEHLNEPLRAGTLAAVANMSLPHYFAQFKRVVGSSPIDYLIKLRMEQARRLLSETSWSVKEVAVSLGYEDPLYFSRVFKSVNQTAPSDFRARTKNPNGR